MLFAFFGFEIFYLSILQIFFFCPIVVLTSKKTPEYYDEPCINQEKKCCSKKTQSCLKSKLVVPLSNLMQTKLGKFLIFVIFAIGLFFSSYGVKNIENSMDLKRVVPDNSPTLKGFGFMDQHVWNDFLQFVFIVKNPPKFDDPKEFKPFKTMINELETLPMAYGTKSNLMWLFDYSKHELNIDYHEANFESINMSHFKDFISTEPYNAWNDGVRWEINPETNETKIKEMLFMITFKGITSLQGKVKALTACRSILDKYPQFDIASFDTDSATVDTILSVPPTLISAVLILVISTAIISCFTMQNMIGTALTTIFTVTNMIYLFGFGYFLDIQLDPLGVGSFVFSILIGNYLVIQAVSIFLKNKKEPNRLQITLETISCQVLKLISVAISIGVPVLCVPVFIHRSNIQIFFLSIAVSTLHVVFFIPTALNLFPAPCTGDSYCYDSE